jgi:hypothetical protein
MCSDFDCVIVFVNFDYSEVCILYGFLLQLTVKCVVLLIVVLIVICDCGFFWIVIP